MADEVTQGNLDEYLAEGALEPPIHPGILYDKLVMRRAGLAITTVASKTGISREMLHRILRGDASVTARTAIGLAEVAGNTPEFWLRVQSIYDLWNERKRRSSDPNLG